MILTIRTDQPDAEIALYSPEGKQIAIKQWHAHRTLADTLLSEIKSLTESVDKDLDDVTGIVVFRGPGSFTGLRIGITVANAFAYGQGIPVVGTLGDDWQAVGIKLLTNGENHKIVLPEYGREANITLPKK